MIAFGCAVTDPEAYRRVALPGIRRAAEPDSLSIVRYGYDSIQRPYNEMIEEAAAHPGVEALVLVHQDLELIDDSLLGRVRPLLGEPDVGVIGLMGGRDVPLHCWWECERLYGRARTPLIDRHYSVGSHEVEVVDGALLVLAPSVLAAIRFDEALAADFHGYDVDFCLRVRAAGQRVVCNDIPYIHRMERPWRDGVHCVRAGRALVKRWGGELHPRERVPYFAC